MFFKDVNKIRDYVKQLWLDYRSDKLDVMSAAVTTDTAFTLLEQSTVHIFESLPTASNYPEMMVLLLGYVETLGSPKQKLADWACMLACERLSQHAKVLEPGIVRRTKPGQFGVYDPKQDRSTLSEEEKQREDGIVLMELLPEFTRLSRMNLPVPAEDKLTSGLRKMMDANSLDGLPECTIFATQMLLDIHHVLREDTARPFEELQATGKRINKTLDDYFRCSRSRSINVWDAQNDQALRQIQTFAWNWAMTDMMAKAAARGSGTVNSRPSHLLKNHPILCGLMVFRLNLLMNDAGIALCNAWGSVVYPAYLYNACRQSANLEQEWEDIEYVLSVHSPTRVFVGAPPTEPAEYHKRFILALGASASNFARNRRPGGRNLIIESKRGPRRLKTTSPVKDIFYNRYVHDASAVLATPNIVAMTAVATKTQRISTPLVDMKEFSSRMLVQKQYTTTQLLTAVREGVAGEELYLLFDYFSLHQRGYKLLRDVQSHVHGDLVKYFGPSYVEEESQLPYVVGWVFEVARGSDRIVESMRLENAGSRMMQEPSDVLARMLQNGIGNKSIAEARANSVAGLPAAG